MSRGIMLAVRCGSWERGIADPLRAFFHPRGAAVLGASGSPSKLSHGLLRSVVNHSCSGQVYPVSPKDGQGVLEGNLAEGAQ